MNDSHLSPAPFFSKEFKLSVTTSDLLDLYSTWRLDDTAIVYRVERLQQGGGFGNPSNHPNTWALAVYVDGQLTSVKSARGKVREWNRLDRLEKWMHQHGFRQWQVVNELDNVAVTR